MKLKTNYFVDALLLLAAGACSVTGLLKMPELGLTFDGDQYNSLSFIHDWTGVACVALFLVHLLLHATWIKHATQKIFFSPKEKATSTRKVRSMVLPGLLLALALVLPAGHDLYAFGGRGGSNVTIPQGITYVKGSLKDGIYTGTANGYMPGLSVEVTVKNGSISAVSITDNNETPRWLDRVRNIIPASIVKAQGTDIDVIAGATCSSYGIMSAVENALKAAKK